MAAAPPPDGDIVVFSAADIKRMSVRTIQDLLNLAPGVKAGDSSVSIRGDSSVAVYLDGMSLINKVSAHKSVNWGLVALDDVESVKIIKGGGAVSFGDNSSGGVIVITSKKAARAKAGVEVEAGNHDYWKTSANVSQRAGAWGVSANGELESTDGFRPNDDEKHRRAGFKLGYAPERWLAWAGPDGQAPTLALDYGLSKKGNPGLPGYATPHARSRDEALGLSLNMAAKGYKSATSLTNFQNDFTNPDTAADTTLRSWTVQEDLRKSYDLPLLGRMAFGALIGHTAASGNKIADVDEQAYSLFANKKLGLKPLPLSLAMGLRANAYSRFDGALNPELRLSWTMGPARLEAGFQMTNNTPTIRQRYYETTSTKPNPDLGSESSANYSLGASYQPLQWLGGNVTVFRNNIDDRITYMRVGGVGRYENVGQSHLGGVDASLSITPWAWLSLRPSYTYLEAIDDTSGLWLPAKPRHKLMVDMQLRPLDGLMLGLTVAHCSEVFTNAANSAIAPAYEEIDLRGEYQYKNARVYFRIENLADADYLYADGYPAPPRTWLVGLGWDF